jgi:hypothetical protein
VEFHFNGLRQSQVVEVPREGEGCFQNMPCFTSQLYPGAYSSMVNMWRDGAPLTAGRLQFRDVLLKDSENPEKMVTISIMATLAQFDGASTVTSTSATSAPTPASRPNTATPAPPPVPTSPFPTGTPQITPNPTAMPTPYPNVVIISGTLPPPPPTTAPVPVATPAPLPAATVGSSVVSGTQAATRLTLPPVDMSSHSDTSTELSDDSLSDASTTAAADAQDISAIDSDSSSLNVPLVAGAAAGAAAALLLMIVAIAYVARRKRRLQEEQQTPIEGASGQWASARDDKYVDSSHFFNISPASSDNFNAPTPGSPASSQLYNSLPRTLNNNAYDVGDFNSG